MGKTFSRPVWRGRWVMTGALLLLTLIVTTIAAQTLPRSYQSAGSVVLLASRAASKPNGNNPYLSFTPSLTLTADVLSREVTAPATVDYLASRGYPGSYTVTLAPETATTTGSVLLLTVSGGNQAAVGRTMLGVIGEIRTRLDRLQAGISRYDQIRVVPLSVSQQAGVSLTATLKPLIVILALCLAAAFGIPWIVDAQVAERRRRAEPGSTAVLPPLARHGANGETFMTREVSHEAAPSGPSRPRSRGR